MKVPLRLLVALALIAAGSAVISSIGLAPIAEHAPQSSVLVVILSVVSIGLIGIVVYLLTRLVTASRRDDGFEFLERSLRQETANRAAQRLIHLPQTVDLAVEPRLEFVHNPFQPQTSATPPQAVEQAFDQANGRLLIVGGPGSGKTTSAHKIVNKILQQPIGGDNTRAPAMVPLLVNLSAWDNQHAFEPFLLDYLSSSSGYGQYRRGRLQAWIRWGGFALFLDGLDEVHPEWQQSCLDRIEEWLERFPPPNVPTVVTCRTQEWHDLQASRGRGLAGFLAVELAPLDDAQLDHLFAHLAAFHSSWRELQAPFSPASSASRKAVREALRRPLTLGLTVDGGVSIEGLCRAGEEGPQAVSQFAVDTYLVNKLSGSPQVLRWLTWVSGYLCGKVRQPGPKALRPLKEPGDATVFQLGRLTPARVPRSLAVGVYGGVVALASFFVLWRPYGGIPVVVLGLIGGVALGLRYRDVRPVFVTLNRPKSRELASALRIGTAVGLLLGVVGVQYFGLMFGISGAIAGGLTIAIGKAFSDSLNPEARWECATLKGPWRASRVSALGLVGGVLASGMACLLVFGLVWAAIFDMVDSGVTIVGPGPHTAIGLGLAASEGLALPIVVLGVMIFGPCVGLVYGGWFLLLQQVAWWRICSVYRLGGRPLNMLERAVAVGVMRQVGSGVRFVHNDVRDALVDRPPVVARDLIAQEAGRSH